MSGEIPSEVRPLFLFRTLDPKQLKVRRFVFNAEEPLPLRKTRIKSVRGGNGGRGGAGRSVSAQKSVTGGIKKRKKGKEKKVAVKESVLEEEESAVRLSPACRGVQRLILSTRTVDNTASK